jgi:hypothetical protein
MELFKDRTIVASDVSGDRDGIGVEVYRNNKLVIEIFRDDAKMTRTVTVFDKETTLELLEESVEIFKKEIPWNFINNGKANDNE